MGERRERLSSGGGTPSRSSTPVRHPQPVSSALSPRIDVSDSRESGGVVVTSSIPQWKRELLERRKERTAVEMRAPRTHDFVSPVAEIISQIADSKKGKEDDNLSDSSEELKYGPGIVSKLKNRYLSLTLRENNGKVRPSLATMRRAASLEDILDEEENLEPKTRYVKNVKATVNGTSSSASQTRRAVSRTKDVKRARSVEALMRHHKTERSSLEERELPPPDLVKQTKKLFEPSPLPATASLVKSSSVPKAMSSLTKPLISPKPVRTFAPKIEIIETLSTKQQQPVIAREATVAEFPPRASPEERKIEEIKKVFGELKGNNNNNNNNSNNNSNSNSNNNKPSPSDLVRQPKQIGVIRPIVTKQKKNLSEREFERNLLNSGSNVKHASAIEQPVTKVIVSLKKSVEECTVLGKPLQTTWDPNKSNTMVFNFRDRKEVPDYIENDGLILCSRKTRDLVLLAGTTTTDSSTDFDADELNGPPSPCEVHVIGGNILINGKSNFQKAPKIRKLKITFNDEATKRFEYPSESSLLEDSEDSTNPDAMSSPLRNTNLANYAPNKLGLASDFELGVTKRDLPFAHHQQQTNNGSHHDIPYADEEDAYLRPADDDATVAWSANPATDLLF